MKEQLSQLANDTDMIKILGAGIGGGTTTVVLSNINTLTSIGVGVLTMCYIIWKWRRDYKKGKR